MIRAVTPVSDVAYSYAGPGRTEVSSFDSLSGLAVTNICGDAVSSMSYAYDIVSRPVSRGGDTFAYNRRGEVAADTVAGNVATYAYDGIGNSTTSTWNGAATTYAANNLNQYESVDSAARSEYLSFGSDGEMIRHDDLLCHYDALSRLSVAYTNDVFAAAYGTTTSRAVSARPPATASTRISTTAGSSCSS